jgi:hypothetical protein
MVSAWLPAVEELKEAFVEEVTELDGSLKDTYDDGQRLFMRAIIPISRQVRPRDSMQGGVALRVDERDIAVHPYVFREVCRNGAIMAETIGTLEIQRVGFDAPNDVLDDVLAEFREGVRSAAREEIFIDASRQIRSATEVRADEALMLMPMLSGIPQGVARQLFSSVFRRFESEGDRTVFGLMNAVTSVARDTQDPEARWELEKYGGGIPARLLHCPTADTTPAEPVGV